MGLHVRVEHGLVGAGVAAEVALEGFGATVIQQVILHVVPELGDKVALVTAEHPLRPDVDPLVVPQLMLGGCAIITLLAVIIPV